VGPELGWAEDNQLHLVLDEGQTLEAELRVLEWEVEPGQAGEPAEPWPGDPIGVGVEQEAESLAWEVAGPVVEAGGQGLDTHDGSGESAAIMGPGWGGPVTRIRQN